MVDFREENLSFSPKWGISEEKTHDIRLNGWFPRRKFMIFAYLGFSEEKTRDICLTVGFSEMKLLIFD